MCHAMNRCEQKQQQQQQQHSSSQASVGADVGYDRVFCGVMRDAVGLEIFFDRKGTFSTAQECPIWSPIRNRPFRSTDPTA